MSSEMTSRERLLSAIRHEEPDRVPVVPRYHAYCFQRYGNNLVEDQLRINRDFGWDNYIALPSLTASLWPNYAWNFSLEDFSPLEREGVRVEVRRKEELEHRLLERTFHTPAGRLSDRIKWPKPGCGYGIRPNGHFLEHL